MLEDSPSLLWVGLFVLLLLAIGLGAMNTYRTSRLEKQNEKLIEMVENLSQSSTENHYNILESILNSRDIEMDTLDLCKQIVERASKNGKLD